MWFELSKLPAIFDDGQPLDRRAYPWLLTSLVNVYVPLLSQNRPPFSRLRVIVSVAAVWYVVPLTIVIFWMRYLTRHDWFGTAFHVLLLATAVSVAMAFYWHARAELSGRELPTLDLKKQWNRPSAYRQIANFCFTAAVGIAVSGGVIEGVPPNKDDGSHWLQLEFKKAIPKVLMSFGHRPFLDLKDAEVSVKPSKWDETTNEELKKALISKVKPANLIGRDLRYSISTGAFFVRARLQRAKLSGANLIGANFLGANLTSAELNNAIMIRANLQRANLNGAILVGAEFNGADLTGAKGLTPEQLDQACGNEKTKLPENLSGYRMKPCQRPDAK